MPNSQRQTALWIFSTFVVWIFTFRGFLSAQFNLISDAPSYYDHTKFLIDNLKHGIYPLWDPFWSCGVPNDFFLRRIGAFNPFYLSILIFEFLGIPYKYGYLYFLALYYWGGMVAFYLLAMRIYHDRFMAYAGYLILLFSALGTRLFDSYMMLVTVPLIWFFYFLLAFSQAPKKHLFLGLLLSLMILAGTYIPFYFLSILWLFLLVFVLTCFDRIPLILQRYMDFFKGNKTICILSLLIVVFSFVPSVIFFYESAHGQVVLPFRHGNAGTQQALVVPRQTLDWGAVEDFFYSAYFSNLKLYKFAVVYVPFFSVIIFALGLAGRITRQAIFMALLGIVLCCCIVPHGLPFYDFFYRHLFFLKYFRNLHFFIWFFLIPLFVLLVLEHWKMFCGMIFTKPKYQWSLLVYVLALHLIALFFVWYRRDAVSSTYLMIFLSLIFWSLMVLRYLQENIWGYGLLTLVILLQPLEAFHYFSLKAGDNPNSCAYNFSYTVLNLQNTAALGPDTAPSSKGPLYYDTGAYNYLYQNINSLPLDKYLCHKISLVDRLEIVDMKNAAFVLGKNFMADADVAVIFKGQGSGLKLKGDDPGPPAQARHLDSNSRGFKVLDFNADHLRFYLDLSYEKLLVYNDSYDPRWKASIDNRGVKIYKVNGAFKGIWVPAGRHIIEFQYGSWRQYAMNILLSLFALMILIGTIYYAAIDRRTKEV